jgi:hypothetical protein
VGRLTAGHGAILSGVALVHDLRRPERFLHTLPVFKVTSPLLIGSYILAPFSAAAAATAAVELLGWFPRLKRFGRSHPGRCWRPDRCSPASVSSTPGTRPPSRAEPATPAGRRSVGPIDGRGADGTVTGRRGSEYRCSDAPTPNLC